MLINDKTYGVLVPGTELLRHGRAPRRSAIDRAPQAWFECDLCGDFKMIRIADVKPHKTVSCGCKRHQQSINYYEQRADNLPASVKAQIFELANHPDKKKRLCNYCLAKKLKLSGYVVNFALAARKRWLTAVARAGQAAKAGLTRIEKGWLAWKLDSVARFAERFADWMAREEFVSSLHWRDQLAYAQAELAHASRINESTAAKAAALAAVGRTLQDLFQDAETPVEFHSNPWHPLAFTPAMMCPCQ